MRSFYWPPDAINTPCLLWALPTGVAPFVVGACDRWLQTSQWASRDDYEGAYNALAEVLACMPSLCVATLVESNERLYRLLDTTLNGAEYTTDLVDGELVITPPIPVVPPAVSRSIHSRLERLEYLQDNWFNGAEHLPDFGETDGARQKLDRIIEKLDALDGADADLLAELEAIAALLA